MLHIWRLLAAILHLGNLQFVDPVSASKQSSVQEAATVRNADLLELIADILGVPGDKLLAALTYKSKLIRRDLCTVVLNAQGASVHRDSLTRALYAALFGYIVEHINSKLCHAEPANFVALLDQAGFSEPSSNLMGAAKMAHFELFATNFAGEMLHGFLARRLLTDQAGYNQLMAQDGVQLPVLNLTNGSTNFDGALLQLLLGKHYRDDAPVPPTTTGASSKGNSRYGGSKNTSGSSANPMIGGLVPSSNFFAIQHFYSRVDYSIDDFLERNLDQISPDFVVLLRNSANKFTNELFSHESSALSVESHPKFERTIVKAQLQTKPKRTPSRRGGPGLANTANRRKSMVIRNMDSTLTLNASAGGANSNNGAALYRQNTNSKREDEPVSTVLTQVFGTMQELMQTMDETMLWHMICLSPNDSQSPSAGADVKRLRMQVNALLLPEIAHRKKGGGDYVVHYTFAEFVTRYHYLIQQHQQQQHHSSTANALTTSSSSSSSPSKSEKATCLDLITTRKWATTMCTLGNAFVWLTFDAWKELEDELRAHEKEERAQLKAAAEADAREAAARAAAEEAAAEAAATAAAMDATGGIHGEGYPLGPGYFGSRTFLSGRNYAPSEVGGIEDDFVSEMGDKDDDMMSEYGYNPAGTIGGRRLSLLPGLGGGSIGAGKGGGGGGEKGGGGGGGQGGKGSSE
ncbi:hypothetical protein BGZ73_002700, partial [Actinomortierella ambigua]